MYESLASTLKNRLKQDFVIKKIKLSDSHEFNDDLILQSSFNFK